MLGPGFSMLAMTGMRMFDFRSDTVTKPTAEMMAAISTAAVGDYARGDDPTTKELEKVAAAITGKEAAVFVPSGTMGNLAALLTHVGPGQEVIVEQTAHIYNSEVGAMAAVAGALPRPIKADDGILSPSALRAAIRREGKENHAATGLVCLENTLNTAGGVVIPKGRMAELYEVAGQAGLPVHLDGARLFNAAAYLNCSVAEICTYTDSVMFSLCKALGAPVGAMLLGSQGFIAAARKKIRMIGGGMRQTGLLAAAALVALEDPFPQLRRDHAMARSLADGLVAIDSSLVALSTVQTNIVNCYFDHFPSIVAGLRETLAEEGVLANQAGSRVRFVTHRHIDDPAIEGCLMAVQRIVGSAKKVA